MSGTGKSTALAELGRRGHRVVDTGDPGWIVPTEAPDGIEPIWDLDRVCALVEPRLRAGAEQEIVTTAPVAEVVAALERVAAAAAARAGRSP
jgi:hypothetical protein